MGARGAMKGGVLVMFLLVVVEVMWFASSMSTMAGAGAKEPDLSLPVLHEDDNRPELRLTGLTSKKYRAFVARVRELLGTTELLGFGLLRSRASVQQFSERFVMVDITNHAEESATLVLDVTNVYVVGYVVGNVSVFIMPDAQDRQMQDEINGGYRFPGTTERHILPFTGGYPALERAAGGGIEPLRRVHIMLGAAALDSSVLSMRQYATRPTTLILQRVATALIVCVQMVSEAARFPRIEFGMSGIIQRGEESVPDACMLSLETHWDDLSGAIQTSNNDGVFTVTTPVRLQLRDYSLIDVFEVRTVAPLIALLLHYCNPAPGEELVLHPVPAAVIRLKSEAEVVCPTNVEPKVRIIGADGLCVDVRDGAYNNGNPIQLWPCKSSGYENQLWTFRTDGTLRSNGKCLASYGHTSGDYIMIYDCNTEAGKYIWRSWPNGTISSATGLMLSTHSSNPGTTLSARVEARNPGQSWLPTNQTQPLVSQIAGLSGLCLHADGLDIVYLRGCAAMESASFWALYPDGSIRPQRRTSTCLSAPPQAGKALVTTSCNPNHALQRWLLVNDGSIVNLDQGFVMDVGVSGGDTLTVNPFAGTDDQVWQALL